MSDEAHSGCGARRLRGCPPVWVPRARTFCATLKSVSAHLAGPALVVVQVNAAGLCPPGAGAAARPPMYLASIPDRELPQALVTFRLSSGAGQARVDLRAGHPSMSTADVA